MKTLILDIENCHGIKSLKTSINFGNQNSCTLYASNGSIKTSLAKVLEDISKNTESSDNIFTERKSKRVVKTDKDEDLAPEKVFVVHSYDESFQHSEKTSTLLIDEKKKAAFQNLAERLKSAQAELEAAIKSLTKTKAVVSIEISKAVTKQMYCFEEAIIALESQILNSEEAMFSDVPYDLIFTEDVTRFLKNKSATKIIESYAKKYNELLEKSSLYKKGVFDYYNASTVSKALISNGYFKAGHKIVIEGDQPFEIESEKQLQEFIAEEEAKILKNLELKKSFGEVQAALDKNKGLRDFRDYLVDTPSILPELLDLEGFKLKVWRHYLVECKEQYVKMLDAFKQTAAEKKLLIEAARNQRTQWENVIEIFNNRFHVPFRLSAKNKSDIVIGAQPLLNVEFTFVDGAEERAVEHQSLIRVLSTGEKRALYILNILFEVERLKLSHPDALLVFDDIADSFDYKNKYAIIEYLKDISMNNNFKLLILTHNFDFFRTITGRISSYKNSLIAHRGENSVTVKAASGINNIFINEWKEQFHKSKKAMVASIPFIRNIVEYTRSDSDPNFLTLTSLLHWKSDTESIEVASVFNIFNQTFNLNVSPSNPKEKVVDIIIAEARNCFAIPETDLSSKVLLSIGIRLLAERHMASHIDQEAKENIKSNQTYELLRLYKAANAEKKDSIKTLERVALMTPENIHLNAFMYEPIIDMSDDHLKTLFNDLDSLFLNKQN